MKEAFWGVLIILLGLFGIVVVNIFQNVTVDNDRVYYLIKESTEASAFDALDLSYYRLSGKLRIVEDKFVENLTRRFAENVTMGDYTIIVEDLNELPPKISLRVRSGVTSLRGEEFGIVNRVDAILETKYSLEEVLEYLDMTEEEWGKEVEIESVGDSNVCNSTINDEKMDCIPGDIKFEGFESANTQNAVCQDETPNANVGRKAKYKVCNCGKWEDKEEMVYANPTNTTTDWIYTWTFNKTGEVRNISETIKTRVPKQICTTDIKVKVPTNINIVSNETIEKDYKDKYFPNSLDVERYITCPAEGIKIPVGMKFQLIPGYIPEISVNRYVDWYAEDTSILSISYAKISEDVENREEKIRNHSINKCILNNEGTNCLLHANVTAKKVGTTYVNVKTTRGQTATCKVEVFNGNIDSLSCQDMNLKIGDSGVIQYSYLPKNATNMNFTYSIDNTKLASISGNTITAKQGGPVTITVKDTVSGKSTTCKLTIPSPVSSGGSGGGGSSSSSSDWYYAIGEGDNKKFYGTLEEAKKAAQEQANKTGKEVVIDYNAGKGNGENPAETVKKQSSSGGGGGSGKDYPVINVPRPKKPPKSPSNPKNCLDKNTKVLTPEGYKDISAIKVGDKVLSYNSEKDINEFEEVVTVYEHSNSKDVLYSIIVNNKVIKATRLHRFYVKTNKGYEYVKVENLEVGDLLVDLNGYYHPIRKITSKFKIDDYYDIEVKNNHNFYIGTDKILVHNIEREK